VVHVLLGAADAAAQVASRGPETIGDRPAEAVEVRTPDGQTRRLYFDAASRLLVAMDQHEGSGSGFSARRLYSDYRNVQGVQWPHLEERLLEGQRVMVIRVISVALDTGVADTMFERPEPELARPTR
jgi:YD repeat-containing protein